MAKGNPRLDQTVREAIARIVEDDLEDPRLTLVTITEAHVTTDQKHANVFWSRVDPELVSDDSDDRGDRLPTEEEVADGLAAASGRIRALLGQRTSLRRVPRRRRRRGCPRGGVAA